MNIFEKNIKMKTLILTRHAKSDWSNLYLDDFDRTLNERGLRDAPKMGKRLVEKNILVDIIVSSTAKRAEQTALLLAEELSFGFGKIIWDALLYHAQPLQIEASIMKQNNNYNTMLLVCHNPGITDYVNSLAGIITNDMPTCGMCAIQFETNQWDQISLCEKLLLFYDFPKNGY
jgi:phosphohistidine phosphatase